MSHKSGNSNFLQKKFCACQTHTHNFGHFLYFLEFFSFLVTFCTFLTGFNQEKEIEKYALNRFTAICGLFFF